MRVMSVAAMTGVVDVVGPSWLAVVVGIAAHSLVPSTAPHPARG